ncbi:hypothetical protein PUN28_020865 [Cardiocondyla obscurior]|uniref:Uncharacterized protein n=1 Tax=Cardiocondyla obscurior TaxID=286306 RepID=A0AAW2E5C6_9HYME
MSIFWINIKMTLQNIIISISILAYNDINMKCQHLITLYKHEVLTMSLKSCLIILSRQKLLFLQLAVLREVSTSFFKMLFFKCKLSILCITTIKNSSTLAGANSTVKYFSKF